MPPGLTRGQPRHNVPGDPLARLAFDRTMQGHGLGGQLLLSAGERCLRVSAEAGGVILAIDAKNERVAEWYAGYGAERLIGIPDEAPYPMVISLQTIAIALKISTV